MIEAGHSGPLLLLAASGLAREAAEVAAGAGREVTGFLDDDPARLGTVVSRWPVLGSLDAVTDFPDAAVVVAVGRGSARESVVARLAEMGIGVERFTTIVDPSVRVPASCS